MEIDSVVTWNGNSWASCSTHGYLHCEDHQVFRLFLCSEKSRLAFSAINYLSNCSKLLLFSLWLPGPEAGKAWIIPIRHWLECTGGHSTSLSNALEQALGSFQGPLVSGICTCASNRPRDNYMPHILPSAFLLLPSTFLSMYWFLWALFFCADFPFYFCLGFAIPTFWPSHLSVSGGRLLPGSHDT